MPIVESVIALNGWRDFLESTTPLVAPIAILIAAARKWLINPILLKLDRHADQHERMDAELRHNGSDSRLPLEEQDLSLRELVIQTRVAQRVHTAEASRDTQRVVDAVVAATPTPES